MYGFLLRPKWIGFHLLVIGSIALMIWLAFWQLERLDDRREFNERVAERIEEPPIPLGELLTGDAGAAVEPDDVEWRQVLVSGTYLPDQILWFNRSQGGIAGDNMLTALITDDGTTVLVNRGFVPLGFDVPPPPSGPVDLLARARVPQDRQRGELTDSNSDSEPIVEVRRIDLDQLAAQLPSPMAPLYLDLIDAVPAPGPDDPAPLPPPALDEGPHLSYAVQWAIFAACVLIGWVLAVRRSVRTRRRNDRAAGIVGSVAGESVRDAAGEPVPVGSGQRDAAGSASSTNGTGAPSPR